MINYQDKYTLPGLQKWVVSYKYLSYLAPYERILMDILTNMLLSSPLIETAKR